MKSTLGTFSISLPVKDLATSLAFYEKLDFTRVGGNPPHFAILRNGNVTVGLFQGMFEKPMLTFNPGWDEACNKLDTFTDVRALQGQLRARGIEPAKAASDGTGPASFVVIDPDGNPVLIDQHV